MHEELEPKDIATQDKELQTHALKNINCKLLVEYMNTRSQC